MMILCVIQSDHKRNKNRKTLFHKIEPLVCIPSSSFMQGSIALKSRRLAAASDDRRRCWMRSSTLLRHWFAPPINPSSRRLPPPPMAAGRNDLPSNCIG